MGELRQNTFLDASTHVYKGFFPYVCLSVRLFITTIRGLFVRLLFGRSVRLASFNRRTDAVVYIVLLNGNLPSTWFTWIRKAFSDAIFILLCRYVFAGIITTNSCSPLPYSHTYTETNMPHEGPRKNIGGWFPLIFFFNYIKITIIGIRHSVRKSVQIRNLYNCMNLLKKEIILRIDRPMD